MLFSQPAVVISSTWVYAGTRDCGTHAIRHTHTHTHPRTVSAVYKTKKKKKKPKLRSFLVRKLNILTKRPPLVGEVSVKFRE
jgi:hypothetical protein